jgi:hypothetical protein
MIANTLTKWSGKTQRRHYDDADWKKKGTQKKKTTSNYDCKNGAI